jgi:excisionase family DNA binding protein
MDQSTKKSESDDFITRRETSEPLWTVDDVAGYLRLNPETVRMKARSGQIPSIKVGKAWRFRLGQITSWMAAKNADNVAHAENIEKE